MVATADFFELCAVNCPVEVGVLSFSSAQLCLHFVLEYFGTTRLPMAVGQARKGWHLTNYSVISFCQEVKLKNLFYFGCFMLES